jgi:hypothetical protein
MLLFLGPCGMCFAFLGERPEPTFAKEDSDAGHDQ